MENALPLYLVCVDENPESLLALKLAGMKAHAGGGHVVLLHVLPPLDFTGAPGVDERMRSEQRMAAERLLADMAVEASAWCTPGVLLREGQVGEEILACAMEYMQAGMLVLGWPEAGSGRGRLLAWLVAQPASKLFMPLLLVPGHLTDQQLQALA